MYHIISSFYVIQCHFCSYLQPGLFSQSIIRNSWLSLYDRRCDAEFMSGFFQKMLEDIFFNCLYQLFVTIIFYFILHAISRKLFVFTADHTKIRHIRANKITSKSGN